MASNSPACTPAEIEDALPAPFSSGCGCGDLLFSLDWLGDAPAGAAPGARSPSGRFGLGAGAGDMQEADEVPFGSAPGGLSDLSLHMCTHSLWPDLVAAYYDCHMARARGRLGGTMAHRPFEFPALGAARPPTPPPPLPHIGVVDNAALAAIMKDKAELDDKACMARASRPRRLRGQRPCPPRSSCSSAYLATSRTSRAPTLSSMPSWCALRCTGSSAAAHDAVSIGRRRATWRS